MSYSAELSQLGAKAALDRFMEVASGDAMPTLERVEAWVDAARERLLEEAAANGSTPRQLACTFLAALVGDGWAAFVQVGDGVIIFDGPDGYDLAFWPDNGEYANTTRFLSEDDYRQHLRLEIVERQVSELAVLTDGLQMLALDTSLLEFMDSKRVNERTDDDKTLLLATRITVDVPPKLPDATA